MEFLKKLKNLILGLILIIGGFLCFVSIGIAMQLYGEDITRHYLLVFTGLILIFFGIVSMYYFVKKDDGSS